MDQPNLETAAEPAASTDGSQVSSGEVQAQLDRILQSAHFQRSERLQRFLRFVCDYTIRGESSLLHEYLIGSEVFSRGPEYSPQEDGIVRRQAHALRRKLQEYYEKEGAADPIRIDLPIGRYVPVFRRSLPPALSSKPAGMEAPVGGAPFTAIVPLPASSSRRWWLAAASAAVIVFAFGWFLGSRSTTTLAGPSSRFTPEMQEFWGPWFDSPAGAVICFSNPLTAVVKHYSMPLSADSKPERVPLSAEQDRLFRAVVPVPAGGFLYFAPAISQAKMGEAIAAVYLTSLFSRAGVPIRATQSRFVTWEDLTREDMILLGNNEANPLLDQILKDRPYQLTATRSDRQRAIVRTGSAGSEAVDFQIQYGENSVTATQEYALISMLPGMDGRRHLLLINGLNTQATQIAAEFLSTQGRLAELLAELRKQDPTHSGPWFFQAVLKTEVHDKVPTNARLMELKVIRR
jgi:hypothetical protein